MSKGWPWNIAKNVVVEMVGLSLGKAAYSMGRKPSRRMKRLPRGSLLKGHGAPNLGLLKMFSDPKCAGSNKVLFPELLEPTKRGTRCILKDHAG